MITKEAIKKEVDKLPDNLLSEVYLLLKKVLSRHTRKPSTGKGLDESWSKNLERFTPDFMSERLQSNQQIRDTFD